MAYRGLFENDGFTRTLQRSRMDTWPYGRVKVSFGAEVSSEATAGSRATMRFEPLAM